LKGVFEELDTKAPYSLVQVISVGFGDILSDMLVKILENVSIELKELSCYMDYN